MSSLDDKLRWFGRVWRAFNEPGIGYDSVSLVGKMMSERDGANQASGESDREPPEEYNFIFEQIRQLPPEQQMAIRIFYCRDDVKTPKHRIFRRNLTRARAGLRHIVDSDEV